MCDDRFVKTAREGLESGRLRARITEEGLAEFSGPGWALVLPDTEGLTPDELTELPVLEDLRTGLEKAGLLKVFMDRPEFTVTFRHTVGLTAESMEDIIESGLSFAGYWCAAVELPERPVSTGGVALLEPWDDSRQYALNAENFLDGFRIWCERGYDHYGAVTAMGVDTGLIDGPAADLIVQLAVFGEAVYG